jgi:hypothetical protein
LGRYPTISGAARGTKLSSAAKRSPQEYQRAFLSKHKLARNNAQQKKKKKKVKNSRPSGCAFEYFVMYMNITDDNFFSFCCLLSGPSAINWQADAGNLVGRVGAQEGYNSAELLGLDKLL